MQLLPLEEIQSGFPSFFFFFCSVKDDSHQEKPLRCSSGNAEKDSCEVVVGKEEKNKKKKIKNLNQTFTTVSVVHGYCRININILATACALLMKASVL